MTAYPLTNGLPIPDDFPTENYEKINSLVSSKSNTNKNEVLFFSASWKGFLYRFLACTEHDKNYRESVPPVGENYTRHERYVVERELFNFLVNGLAAIECLCCALYAIGAIEEVAQPRQATDKIIFINIEKNIRQIHPQKTALHFESKFPNATITTSLKNLFEERSITEDAAKYKVWKKIRDILSHRAQPGRDVPISSMSGVSNQAVPESWNLNRITNEGEENLPNIEFTDNTTASMREWLTQIINNILSESYIFVDSSHVASELPAVPLPLEQLSQPLTDGLEG